MAFTLLENPSSVPSIYVMWPTDTPDGIFRVNASHLYPQKSLSAKISFNKDVKSLGVEIAEA